MARRTPPDRDRYVDFLRALSIGTVVLGHFLIAVIYRSGERIGVFNVVGVASGLWLVTWVLQVMPVFFFVGGFSNHKTYRALRDGRDPYATFMRRRAMRLLKPTAAFAGVWLVVQTVLHLTDTGGDELIRLSFLPFGPLWFLVVYLGVVAATPLMLRLHDRFGVRAVAALMTLALIVDFVRFGIPELRGEGVSPRFGGDIGGVGFLNLAFVWLLAHQLGFFYADGSLIRAGRTLHGKLAVGGLLALVVLTNIGIYPRSMVGTDIEQISNMNPPTLCIVALMFWQIGLVMLLREPVQRWLAKERPWMATIFANGVIMTVFLWHLTAYLIAILVLWPLGLGHERDSTWSWWLQRPIWILVPLALLVPIVALFARFERD